MRLKISHITQYEFGQPVRYGLQQVRTTPKSTHNQTVLNWATRVEGGRKELVFEDFHHNTVELLSFDKNTTSLVVSSVGELDIAETHGVIGRHLGPAPLWLYLRQTPRTKPGTGTRALLRDVTGVAGVEQMHALNLAVHSAVQYVVGVSHPDWGAEEALAEGRGVCQDHAHVFIAAARELGYPARYVSGYLMLNDRVAQDAMHAWAEVHLESLGWVGFDPANGVSPDTSYVRVATGLDYGEAAPVTGTRIGGSGEVLTVAIDVAQQ